MFPEIETKKIVCLLIMYLFFNKSSGSAALTVKLENDSAKKEADKESPLPQKIVFF